MHTFAPAVRQKQSRVTRIAARAGAPGAKRWSNVSRMSLNYPRGRGWVSDMGQWQTSGRPSHSKNPKQCGPRNKPLPLPLRGLLAIALTVGRDQVQ